MSEVPKAGLAGPVSVDLELCKACDICIDLCPEHVFDRDKLAYPVVARPDDCTACLLCEFHCPDFAIEVERRVRRKPATEAAPQTAEEAEAARVIAAVAGPRPDPRGDERPASSSECGEHGGED